MYKKGVKFFLRLAISLGFLSAVADRFGFWSAKVAVWGDWSTFLTYTQLLNPFVPESMVPAFGAIATIAEVVFAVGLLIGFKTSFFAKCSGILLLLFALAMTFSTGIKSAFDASVFSASAGAFAISLIKE